MLWLFSDVSPLPAKPLKYPLCDVFNCVIFQGDTKVQKREDLKAARIVAGLSQLAAAELIGVDRGTYNRWETGKRSIPEVKFYRFLKLTGVTPQALTEYWAAIPKALVYDDDGYPAPFTRIERDNLIGDNDAFDAFYDRLEKLEGSDHPHRERVREEKEQRRTAKSLNVADEEAFVAAAMARWDQEPSTKAMFDRALA